MEKYSIKEIKQKLNHYLIKGYEWMNHDSTKNINPIIYATNRKDILENAVDIDAGREIRGLLKMLKEKRN